MTSRDLTASNIAKLAELFPGVITESVDADGNAVHAVDLDSLRQELSDHVVEGPQERYQLDWPGKRAAAFAGNAPITKTLRPVREESVDFDATRNLFIEGDNLDALKLLQESYLGKVKLIYVDPPYNTGNDFIYDDDFAEQREEYLERSGQSDEVGARLVSNTEANGRFHSDWLSMVFPRLRLARNLLKDDGAIFVSINDREVAQLRKALDQTFGASNFIAQIIVKTGGGRQDSRHFAVLHEYALVYAKSIDRFEAGRLEKEAIGFNRTDEQTGRRYKTQLLRKWGDNSLRSDRPNLFYAITDPDGEPFYPMAGPAREGCWRWGKERMFNAIENNLVEWSKTTTGWVPYEKVFAPDEGEVLTRPFGSLLEATGSGAAVIQDLFGSKVFSYPKSVELIEQFIAMANVRGSEIVMDFFAGSSTTAHAVLSANAKDHGDRRFIMVQLDETIDKDSVAGTQGYKSISALSRERIRRAGVQLLESHDEVGPGLDVGFRSLRVDTSNMTDVLRAPDETFQEQLDVFGDSIKTDRSGEDLLFQVLLEWGLDISAPIVAEELEGHILLAVEDDALLACFDDDVSVGAVRAIAKRGPLRAVFRDSGFRSDSDRINAEQIFEELSPTTELKAI